VQKPLALLCKRSVTVSTHFVFSDPAACQATRGCGGGSGLRCLNPESNHAETIEEKASYAAIL
jgi:hypothetical protein